MSSPLAGQMQPYPFVSLYHFTCPVSLTGGFPLSPAAR